MDGRASECSGACDCSTTKAGEAADKSWRAALLPAVACAACPACVGVYSQVATSLGLGVSLGLDEWLHDGLLGLALVVTLAAAGWRARRRRDPRPIIVAGVACSMIVSAHLLGEIAWLEWAGIGVLLSGAALERRLPTRPAAIGTPHATAT